MRAYKKITVDDSNSSTWTFATTVVIVVSLIIIVIACRCIIKRKCNFSHKISKRIANVHDFENADVKLSPSHDDGENIEMSVARERGNVSNDSEGQNKTFRQTDAMD